jgi:O-antigen/teichoic acid export membrane protein/O-antigen ligase
MAAARVTLESRWRSAASRPMAGSLIASGGLQLLMIASGVIVARGLGPQDRGYFALLLVVSGICTLIGNLGLPSAVTYYVARDRSHARAIASSLLRPAILLLAATLALQIAILAALVMHEPEPVKFAATVSLLLAPGVLALAFGIAILQGQQRFTAVNVLRILPTMAYVAAVVVAFLLHSADLVLVMTLWVTVHFVGGFLALGVAVRGLPRVSATDDPPSRSQMTKFGLKGLLGTLSPIEAFRLDQAVVGLFLSPVALGLYVVAQAFTNLPRVVAATVGMVAYPNVASQSDPRAAHRAMWRYFFFGLAVSVVVVWALEVVSGTLVTLFFGNEFRDATPIVRILLLGTLFLACRRVLTDGVNGLGHPGLGTIAEVASWVLLLPALAILLPHGAEGVALALTISWGASLLLLLVLVGLAGTRWSWAARAHHVMARFKASRGLVTGHQLLGVTAAVAAATAAGIAVTILPPRMALVVILVLSAALFFAFARTALRQKSHSLRISLARARSSPRDLDKVSSQQGDAEFRLARRLYYVGLVFLGLLTLRAGGQVTYSDILFLFGFVFACTELAIIRRHVPIRVPFLLLLGIAIFSLGGLLSTFQSYEALKSTAVIVRLILLTVLWFWLGTIVLSHREHVRKAMTLWVTSAAVCGGAATLQLLIGNVIPGTSFEGGRATGFTTHPNDLGALTCIALIPALMLATRHRIAVPQRLFSYALLLLIVAGLILSGSIGALLAAGAATFVWFSFQRTSLHSILVFITLGLCVIAITTVQAMRGAPTPLERFGTVTSSSPTPDGGVRVGSVDARIATYRVAVDAIKEHPFVGVGLDLPSVTKPFGVESYEYDQHNLIIGIWYKTGLIGLAGMLIALFAVFRTGWITILQSKSEGEWRVSVALVSSVVAFVVIAMSEPVLFSRFGWISAALLLALRAVQQRESASARVSSYKGDLGEIALTPARP